MSLTITIPGEPVAQGRPRAYRMGAGVRLVDPEKSRSWKGVAQVHMREAIARNDHDFTALPHSEGPLQVHVTAVYTCPKSAWRKRDPLPRRRKVSKPDADNIGKACLDAGNGLLYLDDSQVARLVVDKFIGAQGEAPHVVVEVSRL